MPAKKFLLLAMKCFYLEYKYIFEFIISNSKRISIDFSWTWWRGQPVAGQKMVQLQLCLIAQSEKPITLEKI